MAKDARLYGAQADVSDLQYQLREKTATIAELKFQLETSQKDEEATRELYQEKKEECLKLEDSLTDTQSDLGKWKFLANQKGASPAAASRQSSRDLENRLQALQSENRRLQQQILFTPPPPQQQNSRRVQQLEEEVYRLRQTNATLDQRLRTSQDEQQKLQVDLKYAKAELGEIQHRLQEKTQENLRKKDIISHLESRQRDGAVDSTTQARIKHLEDHIMQLEQHRAVRRMSESTNPTLQRQLAELKDENAVLKTEAIIYQEDFLRERDDRGKEHSRFLEAEAKAKRAEQRVLDLEAIVTALNN